MCWEKHWYHKQLISVSFVSTYHILTMKMPALTYLKIQNIKNPKVFANIWVLQPQLLQSLLSLPKEGCMIERMEEMKEKWA